MQNNQKLGVLSLEMECAAIFTGAELRGLRLGAVLGFVGNVAKDKHTESDETVEPLACTDKKKAENTTGNAITIAVGAVNYLNVV